MCAERAGVLIGGGSAMKSRGMGSLILLVILGGGLPGLLAQEDKCRAMDPESGRKFLPDRAPLGPDSIAIDNKIFSGIQFPDKARTAIAALTTSGLSEEARRKFQYVLVSESKLKLGRWTIPAGMNGLGLAPAGPDNPPTRILITYDFLGTETERIALTLDPQAEDVPLALIPKGPKEFELRIGKYSIQGSQR